MTDPLNLDDLRANLQGATPRPWSEEYIWSLLRYGRKHDLFDDSPEGTNEPEECDAAIIVAAVNALPQLLDKIKYMHAALTMENEGRKRLEAEVERLRGLLQEVLMDKTVGMTLGEAADLDARIAAACGEVKP